MQVLRGSGVRITHLELSNEPDGDWSCRIRPAVYAELLKHTRKELDAVGETDVGLAGPGLFTLNRGGIHTGPGLFTPDRADALGDNSWAGPQL